MIEDEAMKKYAWPNEKNCWGIINVPRFNRLLSYYVVAREFNYVKPNVVESKVIEVKTGRHPIQEHIDSNYVPNDIYSSGEKGLVKLFTGPNACGKSMYLKQVALIVFMAHIGSYVPAESATIGIVKHIFLQMGKKQSYMFDLSFFGVDMRQVYISRSYFMCQTIYCIGI